MTDGSSSASPATVSPPPAKSVMKIGRFRIIAKLGKGGMGTVYRAVDEKLSRYVALKIIAKDAHGKPTFRTEAFLREAKSVAQLDHPNVVQVFEIGETEKYSYIAMELLEGGDLWQIFRAAGPIELGRAALFGAEAAEALAYAHSCGIVHRDIKPANLMLARNGRCKLTDFGLARFDDPNDLFALPSENVGTPFYIAPEVIRGNPAGPPADVYSLAVTLWIVLVGKSPFDAKTRQELFAAKLNHPLPDLRQIRRDLPESFVVAMERALDREPTQRPQMSQFARLLRLHVSSTSMPTGELLAAQAAKGASGIPAAAGALSTNGLGTSRVDISQAGAISAVSAKPSVPAPVADLVSNINPDELTLPIDTPSVVLVARALKKRKRLTIFAAAGLAVAIVVIAWLIFAPGTAASLPPIERVSTSKPTAEFDAANISALAARLNWGDKSMIGVKGVAASVEAGSSCFIRFKGTDFIAEFPASLSGDMQRRFGGSHGEDLCGKKVTVVGVLSGSARQPSITITSVDQLIVTK